ncbi:unnamed protein product [Nippostrongylus brasiliensis]|uniref:Serine/arginine repetitive matrix protein 2 n=1 Tax=Nippostrongylus brasiliensis TaxID=27835 RepID=A0A0N4YLM8_NIPBR|nr:hypothetical protein Q1695_005551 [Nippostrongylus brasiliensis]VDL81748.1 unnamed protein product [Nippostrongylus brasiliensis]
MGASQSTSRAAKFSGSRRRVRNCNSAPPSAPTVRRQLSQRNTNRNVKEFSKFWSGGGNLRPKGGGGTRRSESVRRSNSVRRPRNQSTEPIRKYSAAATVTAPQPTPFLSPRSPRNSYPHDVRPQPQQQRCYMSTTPRYDSYENDVIYDSNPTRVFESNPERLHAFQFPHETAIY